MLDYCGEHGIVSDIELIPMAKINEAKAKLLYDAIDGSGRDCRIHDNRLESTASSADTAIQLIGTQASAPGIVVHSNQVSGYFGTGVILWPGAPSNAVIANAPSPCARTGRKLAGIEGEGVRRVRVVHDQEASFVNHEGDPHLCECPCHATRRGLPGR